MHIESVEKNFAPVQQNPRMQVLPGGKSLTSNDPEVKLPEQDEQKTEKKETNLSLEQAVEQTNKTMETYNTELKFSIHEESGEVMVKVIDTRDNSVVREIPPERVLDFAARVKKMLGLVLDKLI